MARETTIKLWTHHPGNFQLDTATEIDHTKGQYWNMKGLRYREVLPKLHKHLGTNQFLWCCTMRRQFQRTTEEIDLVEWELEIPCSGVLSFYHVPIWEEIVRGRSEGWDELFPKSGEVMSGKDIDALVRFPLRPEWLTCLGPLPVRY